MTYCEECVMNLEDDLFDYRFKMPVCFECVEALGLIPGEEE
jgi:hypothetical protein